ncbi:MAG: chemotaxis protein CheA [Candidatus Sulfotelmatobacter sp.]
MRVDVSLLDQLMNLVGELVLARNQILQFTNSAQDAGLLATSQRLNLITTELQEGVMKTRMQPIGNVWSKFPRLVRDLALGCGKQVRIMEGKETELDKTIIEAIKDPLTHLVRNSVDHGIETPEERRKAGKTPEGSLLLRAFHEGGQVNIEICDDGAGLNLEKIRNKAILKGLITSDQAVRMSDREIANLIFMAGLSTADKVTNVSGRGVGMDVVKTNIEKIGGTVDVQSKTESGSTIRVKIPLTLAIIPALMVTSGGDRYAIPQVSLLELVGLEGEQARKGIELIQGTPVYRLRGRLLPLVCLNRELGVEKHGAAGDKEPRLDFEKKVAESQSVSIVVLQAEDRQFGLVVDAISDTEEIVVKPLSKQLKGINVYAGATILGDGRVALILDVLGLAQSAHVVGELLFQYGESGRMAIDLSLVARLEEFRRDAVELAGGQPVVQYREQIVPLIRVSHVLHGAVEKPSDDPNAAGDRLLRHGRSIGLVIDRILDIVDDVLVIQKETARKGVTGSAVIQKRITDILNVPELMAMAASASSAAAHA